MMDLLTLGGTQARGVAINNLGQITGSSSLDGDPPFGMSEAGIVLRTHAFVTPPTSSTFGQTITFGGLPTGRSVMPTSRCRQAPRPGSR